jgi:hypothetical protein
MSERMGSATEAFVAHRNLAGHRLYAVPSGRASRRRAPPPA